MSMQIKLVYMLNKSLISPGVSQLHRPGESHLPSVPGGDDADVGGVLDGYDGPGRQQQLLPGTPQVDDVHT